MDVSSLVPLPALFTHPSRLHGQAHVARVMVHALRLVDATGLQYLAPQLWAAVYLHDLARTHDGVCRVHGRNAVKRWHSERALEDHVAARGVPRTDKAVALAVTLHCRPNRDEPPPDHPDWKLVALLKDADGLDRVRLGDLDPSYLRLPESPAMVDFAEELFERSSGQVAEGDDHFRHLLALAEEILDLPVSVPVVLNP